MHPAWHAASNGEPNSDVEVARHFNQRPIVGICLKRYIMTEQGVPIRHNTLIDIPDSMRLPHFMVVDDARAEQASNGLSQEYKLVLQSVVCHRGESLHSGHYIAFARVAPKLLTENRRHDHDPPPDYEEAQWAKFDDLATDKRVVYVDDIKQSLREEMPYLLFYQIVPMVDVTAASTDGSVTEPPSYFESATNVPGTPTVEAIPDNTGGASGPRTGLFDSTTTLAPNRPSVRLSADFEQPSRFSFDDDPFSLPTKTDTSRRASAAFSDAGGSTRGVSPGTASPAVSVAPQDESATARLSRAAAKFTRTGGRSRPTSQIGEGRISITMSKFGFARNRDGSNSAASDESVEDQARPTATEGDDVAGKGREKEKAKDKEKDNTLKPQKKGRSKSGGRDKEEKKEKDKGKDKEKGKASKYGGKDGVPDRECSVM